MRLLVWIQFLPSPVQAFTGAVYKGWIRLVSFTRAVNIPKRWKFCPEIREAVLTKASKYFLEEWNIWPISKYFSLVHKSFSHHLVPVDHHECQTPKLHAEDVPIATRELKESPLSSENNKMGIFKTHLAKTLNLTLLEAKGLKGNPSPSAQVPSNLSYSTKAGEGIKRAWEL